VGYELYRYEYTGEDVVLDLIRQGLFDNHVDTIFQGDALKPGQVHPGPGYETGTFTDQEIKLLQLFIINRGKPLSRETILEIGWGYTRPPSTRTVDNFIVRFRKYFEDDPKKPIYFKSIRSVGYVFDHE
jgi:DNA-binding response OmpR family regulator